VKALVLCDHDLPTFKDLPAGPIDLILGCGDIQDSALLQAAKHYGVPIYAVKGNHDVDERFPKPIVDLHLNCETFQGLTFAGFQGAPRYKPRGHFLYDEDEVVQQMAVFPRVDVFIAHSPPRGTHDRDDVVHQGFEAFRRYVLEKRPAVMIHGHVDLDKETKIAGTRIVAAVGTKIVEL
jgi:Icc-related predicted phosphoesterase